MAGVAKPGCPPLMLRFPSIPVYYLGAAGPDGRGVSPSAAHELSQPEGTGAAKPGARAC